MYRTHRPDGTVAGPPPSVDRPLYESVLGRLETFARGLDPRERNALAVLVRGATPEAAIETLGAVAPEEILAPDEQALVARLDAEEPPRVSGLRPTLVLVMKATRRCNLRCTYCHFWSDEPGSTMSFEVLAHATHAALTSPGVRVVELVWHGGEATLMPVDFYRKAIWLQQRYRRPGQRVVNALQTNGTHLTPAWIDFLRSHRIQVGISLDGPPEVHDRRRVDVAGRPTSKRVREGLARIAEAGIEHGVLMVVDDDVIAVGVERLLDYFLDLGVAKVALLNAIPENVAAGTGGQGAYVGWRRFVEFLRELFRVWWPRYADRIAFREISDLMVKVRGRPGALCVFDGNCMGGFLTIEPNGDIAACDKYIDDASYRFGNVRRDGGLAALPVSPAFGRAYAVTAAGVEGAAGCRWHSVCRGGCPHDRYLRLSRGIPHDESCCGLAPLLEDIARALGTTVPEPPPSGGSSDPHPASPAHVPAGTTDRSIPWPSKRASRSS